ncbi:hypothetical protein GCM10027275_15660 [Rhabdobacter roseus]|uniref:Glycosyltransferase RgtA/B/C/D-like domain-containing protein n=1 Tax=Rhabdobacter roseus TaxID=1655419 RepID=A0A840TH60_9BACT|nr:hypothetical protein [Rhabdobacter roseus]MBB5283486.1 hypothetical protein [Rhabdobacter roseus]
MRIKTNYLQLSAYFLLGMLWCYTMYVSVLNPPFMAYFTVDENFIADSGVFLWYGNTPRCLDWPATPSLLIFCLLFGISTLASIISHRGTYEGLLDIFEQFDRNAYQYLTDRQDLILTGRTIQLLMVGTLLVLTVRFLFRHKHPLLTPASRPALAFLIVTSYVVWFNAPVLRPEALAGTLFLYLVVQMLFTEQATTGQIRLWAILFGLILAQRLIFLFLAPAILVGVFLLLPANQWKGTLRFIGLTILLFVAACPFLLTDPLVVAKSFVGGIIAKMNDEPMGTWFNYTYIGEYFKNPVSYLLILLCLLGMVKLVGTRKWFYGVLVLNWIFFLFLVLRSAKIYDTHVLPAGIITVLVAALGAGYLAEAGKKVGTWTAIAFVMIVAFSNLREYWDFQARSHANQNKFDAYRWIISLPSETSLLLPPDLEFYVPKAQSTLLWESEQNRDTLKMARKINYILRRPGSSLEAQKFPVVALSFAFEDERLYDTQYRLLLKYTEQSKRKVYNYEVYLDNTELASHSVQREEAMENFRSGKRYRYMVSENRLDDSEPIKEFTGGIDAPLWVYEVPL